jgi:hypothetical protein
VPYLSPLEVSYGNHTTVGTIGSGATTDGRTPISAGNAGPGDCGATEMQGELGLQMDQLSNATFVDALPHRLLGTASSFQRTDYAIKTQIRKTRSIKRLALPAAGEKKLRNRIPSKSRTSNLYFTLPAHRTQVYGLGPAWGT